MSTTNLPRLNNACIPYAVLQRTFEPFLTHLSCTGPQGDPGAQGIQGVQGSGSQGFQGASGQGTQGSQGVQGSGSQGSQGVQGSGGGTVASGTSGRVPYETTGGVLTDSAKLTFDGTDLLVGARSSFGNSAATDPSTVIVVSESATDNCIGIDLLLQIDPTFSYGTFRGINSQVYTYGSSEAGSVYGVSGIVGARANTDDVYGLYSTIYCVDSGRIARAHGVHASVNNYGIQLIANAYVIHVESTSGAITNAYGLKIENQTGATNNWAIKTGTGKVEFGDVAYAAGFGLQAFGEFVGVAASNRFTFDNLSPSITAHPLDAAKSVFGIRAAASQAAPLLTLQGISSTSTARDLGYLDAVFAVSTDASHTGRVTISAADYSTSHTGRREGLRVESDATQAKLGFYGATAVAKPSGDIGTALTNLGLMTSPTVAATVSGGTSGRIPYETSGGVLTDNAKLTFDGTDLLVGARASFGNNASTYPATAIVVSESATDNATGIDVQLSGSPTSDGAFFRALSFSVATFGDNQIAASYGGSGFIYNRCTDSSDLYGLSAAVLNLDSGKITRAYGLDAAVNNYGFELIADAFVLHVQSMTGPISNAYGLKIENQTEATNNWAIKTGTGKVEFGDIVYAAGFTLQSFGTYVGVASSNRFSFDNASPSITAYPLDAAKSVFGIRAAASQTAPLLTLQGISSTSTARELGVVDAVFVVSTDASHTGRVTISAADYTTSHTGRREGLRVESDGTQAKLGFYGATAVAKPSGDIATALSGLGLMTSPTVAVASGTSGRVPFETTGGVLTDSAALAFDGTNLVVLTGAAGASPAVFRQTGGTAGVKEVQVYHDGTTGHVHTPTSGGGLRLSATSAGAYIGSDFSGDTDGMAIGAGSWIVGSLIPSITLNATGFEIRGASYNAIYITNPTLQWPTATPDLACTRSAAGLLKVTDGSTGLGQLLTEKHTIRQSGGTPGTSEIQISHDGTTALLENMSGSGTITAIKTSGSASRIHLVARDMTYIFTDGSGSGFSNPSQSLLYGDVRMASTAMVGWSSSSIPASASNDVALVRSAEGVLKATNGASGLGQLITEKHTIRQSGGTPGTSEIQISHDGTTALLENMAGSGTITAIKTSGVTSSIQLAARDKTYIFSDGSGNGFNNPSQSLLYGDVRMASTAMVGWSSNSAPVAAQNDVALVRSAEGVLKATNGSTGLGQLITEKHTIRQSGGTPGTSEIQISHDGTNGYVKSMAGDLRIVPPDGNAIRFSSGSSINTDTGSLSLPNVSTFYIGGTSAAAQAVITSAIRVGSSSSYDLGATAVGAGDVGLGRAAAGVAKIFGSANNPTGSGGLSSPGNTPTQLAANANDYSPGVGLWQRWNASAPVNVTGMVAGQAGEMRTIANVGGSTITLTNQDAASTAANRWLTTTGADLALAANRIAWAIYDATTAAWRVSLLP